LITVTFTNKDTANYNSVVFYTLPARQTRLVDARTFLLCIGTPQQKHGASGVFVQPSNYSISELLPAVVLV